MKHSFLSFALLLGIGFPSAFPLLAGGDAYYGKPQSADEQSSAVSEPTTKEKAVVGSTQQKATEDLAMSGCAGSDCSNSAKRPVK